MYAIIARMQVEEDKVEEFLDAMKVLAQKVREEEKGCLQYQLCRSREGNTYVVFERYADKEALNLHGETPHFAEGMAKLSNCLSDAPDIEILRVVE